MKKFLALLLASATVLTFAACTVPSDVSVDDESGVTELSNDVSDVSAEESSEFIYSAYVEPIKELLCYDVDRTQKADNIFAGKQYTLSRQPSESYLDNGYMLTNGVERTVFDKYNWVGFTGSSPLTIDFDLGENSNRRLACIKVGTLRQVSYGIGSPKYVKVSASKDGENYYPIGQVNVPDTLADSQKYVFNIGFAKATDARYIRIDFGTQDHGFLFIDEICGYQYFADGYYDLTPGAVNDDPDYYYDYYSYDLKTEGFDIASGKGDTVRQNLALLDGVNLQMQHFDPISKTISGNDGAELFYKLHDGVYNTSTSYSDPAYFRMVRGGGRYIDFDFGSVVAVDEIKATFLGGAAGIGIPPALYISVSVDGKNWVTVAGEFTHQYVKSSGVNYNYDGKFDAVKARYVRMAFPTELTNAQGCMVYISEIEVWGTKDSSNAKTATPDSSIVNGSYPSTEDIGVENLYFGAVGTLSGVKDHQVLKADAALSVFADRGTDSSINGTFCDSICLTYNYDAVNGDNAQAEYNEYLRQYFSSDVNIGAVDNVKGEINTVLGQNEKITVWVAIHRPDKGTKFGDTTVKTTEDAINALKWQVDRALEVYGTTNYKNIEFKGFYWCRESLYTTENTTDDSYDVACVTAINEYIHSKGYMSFWCPYYNAYDIWKWHDVGFDFACLQPNYMFYNTAKTRVATAAKIAYIMGMCVEIEIEDIKSEDSVALYQEYLRGGVDYSYMTSIKMYYQGAATGAFHSGATSKTGIARQTYEDTVAYAHNELDKTYGISADIDMEALKKLDGSELTAVVGKSQKLAFGNIDGLDYQFIITPSFGSVKLNLDGTLVYTAMRGYIGPDQIKVALYSAYEIVYITINVTVVEG